MGPKRQCRNMGKARRRVAVLVYFSFMLATLITAFACHGKGCTLIIMLLVFGQWCAAIWYIASYIPYGQRMITRILGGAANSISGGF